MKYYDIHVKFGNRDKDGYSIPIAIEEGGKEEAIQQAADADLFEYEEDRQSIDNVQEISKEEYEEMTGTHRAFDLDKE